MRKTTVIAIAMLLTHAAFAQSQAPGDAITAQLQARPAAPAPAAANPVHAAPAKPAAAASTPESRSAAALALSHEPTFDEGTAARIKDAALSYCDLAVRGGWPTIPADAKFAVGTPGPNDDLLRRRLLITGDLAADKPRPDRSTISSPRPSSVSRCAMALPPTGTVTPRTLAALNVPVQKRIKQLEASLERLDNMNFPFGKRYVVVNLPATFAEAVEDDMWCGAIA